MEQRTMDTPGEGQECSMDTHAHKHARARTNANMQTLESLLVFLEGAI